MPMPRAYRHASAEFKAFLDDLCDRLDTHSDNVAYTTAQAVLLVFRARLTVVQGLAFADALPAVLRAIFVAGWDISGRPRGFSDRATLTAEVLAFRQAHNFAPRTAIADVAWALRRHADARQLRRALELMPPEAQQFWALPEA